MSQAAQDAQMWFRRGYNCAQSVFLAFSRGLSEQEAARLASSFGGGMGRLRETCGAVSGMLLALGYLRGYSDPDDRQAKIAHYAAVRELVDTFRKEHGSIICRELLKDCPVMPGPDPQVRDAAYYATRPCLRLIAGAAEILERYLEEENAHP